jgi:hypothetical protein
MTGRLFQSSDQQYKWASFTYVGNETRVMAKLFRRYNLKVAFKTSISLEKNTYSPNNDSITDKGKWDVEINLVRQPSKQNNRKQLLLRRLPDDIKIMQNGMLQFLRN